MRAVILATLLAAVASETALPAAEPTYADVAAVLDQHCVVCHRGEGAPLGLRLDSLAGLVEGSQRGLVTKRGDPEGSEIVRRLRGTSQPRMPLTGPPYLDDATIGLIARWIATGMPASDGVGDASEAQTAVRAPPPRSPAPGEPVRYADVRPIFLQRCVKCHRDGGLMGAPPEGVRLLDRDQILRGGERVVVLPGNPRASAIVRRIEGLDRPRMPFDGPPYLSEEELWLITEWIDQGAPADDGSRAPLPVGARVRLRGTLTGHWAVDGVPVSLGPDTRIDKRPAIGAAAEVRGVVAPDGSIHATRIRRR